MTLFQTKKNSKGFFTDFTKNFGLRNGGNLADLANQSSLWGLQKTPYYFFLFERASSTAGHDGSRFLIFPLFSREKQ